MLSLYKSSTNVMITQRIGNLGLKLVEYNNRRCQLIQEGKISFHFSIVTTIKSKKITPGENTQVFKLLHQQHFWTKPCNEWFIWLLLVDTNKSVEIQNCRQTVTITISSQVIFQVCFQNFLCLNTFLSRVLKSHTAQLGSML